MLPSKAKHFEPASIHVEATNIKTLIELKRELVSVLSIIDELELATKQLS
jgi:predicted component of type VI protein secretion system